MSKSAVDGTWSCPQCGAWNAEWLDKCGNCKEEKDGSVST